ncbi:MAG: alanine dehydrogenase [Acidimicrobiia bacterium]
MSPARSTPKAGGKAKAAGKAAAKAKAAGKAKAKKPAGLPESLRVPLVVGVPRETKDGEHRVAITPDGVAELVHLGTTVVVETGAGLDSSITDEEYLGAGAQIAKDATEVWERGEIVCKVKEPQADELGLMWRGQILFTYLHLAAYPDVAKGLLDRQVIGVAYETVQLDSGALPLLAPMSEVAGRMAPQIGAHFLEHHNGGRGVLMGGAPGVRPARVVVLGAGNVGWNAAWIAAGMEAEVWLLDRNLDRLRWVDQIHKGRILTLASNRGAVARAVTNADLVVGAVLVPGGRAPVLVTEDMVAAMRPRAVVVDCAIDQGGCLETSRETTHAEPVYEVHGVVHYCVGNVPGAVPVTSTKALTNATLPYLVELAVEGPQRAAASDPALAAGFNTVGGRVVNAAVGGALGYPPARLDEMWGA